MIRVGAIIQARNRSTRLPGKVMRDVMGEPVIMHVVRRVRSAALVDDVLVATTDHPSDDAMALWLEGRGVRVFRGDMNDVLGRYYAAARAVDVRHVVRITADCPLIDGKVIDEVVRSYQDSGADYACNILKRTFPDGQDAEVFSFAVLERAWREAVEPREREHVTVYMRQHPELFRLHNIEHVPDWGRKRWTLDYEEDFVMIEAVFRHFTARRISFGMEEIAQYLSTRPDLEALNSKYVK